MTSTNTTYYCDSCGRTLSSPKNNLAIVTEKADGPFGWRRLRVRIEHHHGSQNDVKKDDADLCRSCAILLLEDALIRVKKNERASEGVESPKLEPWPKNEQERRVVT